MKIKKESIELIILVFIAILLIAFSADAKNGAKHGLDMAAQVMIPGLLPLLTIFNLISKTESVRLIQNLLAPFTEKVLRLPRAAGSAIVFGLVGGYPTGAILTESLYANDDIDEKTAKRLLSFNVNGGVGFIITAVGTIVLKSERAGILLFASTTLAALLIAFVTSFRYEKISRSHAGYSALPLGEALNVSTQSSVHAVLNVSAYIILFSAVFGVVKIPEPLLPLIEITGGIVDNYRLFSLPEIAFLLSFSGLCLHFQLLSIIKKLKMSYFEFFAWRILHALFSYGVCFLLLQVFPTEISVFSNSAQSVAVPFSLNLTLSALMIIGCAVIVLDIESKKRKC
ncbi:MAG: hypothetical protein J1E05_02290 [Eubacterium sp.]|nr:hypothetical protein [Eubacterium sp.]